MFRDLLSPVKETQDVLLWTHPVEQPGVGEGLRLQGQTPSPSTACEHPPPRPALLISIPSWKQRAKIRGIWLQHPEDTARS